ncbi:MAG: bifunctional folylpolyglutamate synthase/dihydrofolate synthase [Clostridia bacterium]|nr:bifunctional folylpolyglutamate synthase/dihydrofolate synthase [Clostridia bacterium]
MTYEEAMAYIHSVNWLGSRPGLERITVLCEKLGHPERELRFIHVGGTNGKGSFCCMLSNILREAGYRTGLYTSPYIERFNERMQIDGMPIPDDELAALTAQVKAVADTMDDPPTEFELITALCFLYFRNNRCDYVVLEVGLGGRLDSTNIIPAPVLAVITGIDYDHTAILGDTTAKIAAEKAGIIKAPCPVLFGEGDADAAQVILDKTTHECGGDRFHRTDFTKITDVRLAPDKTVFTYGTFRDITLQMLGLYQLHNAANVLTAVELLREEGLVLPDQAVYDGLAAAHWPARFEKLMDTPLVFYDGAHNPQGIRGAAENIKQYLSPAQPDGKIVLCMGVLRDKDFADMIAQLAPLADRVFTVTPDNPRALPAAETAQVFRDHGTSAQSADSLEQGVQDALAYARESGRALVVLGSLYIYGDVKKALGIA